MGVLAAAGCHDRQPSVSTVASTPSTAVGAAQFHDAATSAGVDFAQSNGATGKFLYIEETGGGCAFIDYDNDGYPDILLVQSGRSSQTDPMPTKSPYCGLFHNNRNGTFTNVTKGSGFDVDLGYGQGLAVGDVDDDGYDDVYVTGYNGNHLLHNDHGTGKFTDVTLKAGVGDTDQGPRYSTGAAFGDYDGDGRLDLYVNHYSPWTPAKNIPCKTAHGELEYCTPDVLDTESPRLYHNNGDGTFTDVSKSAGMAGAKGHGLGVVWLDYDGDGREDIFVTNDLTPSFLWHNEGGGKFKNVADRLGCAYDENGKNMAGMGIGIGDYNNSGRESLFVTNFSEEPNTLFQLQPGAFYTDASMEANLAVPHMKFLAFGCDFMDYDADGWKDLIVANGHVQVHIADNSEGITYAERKQLFHNDGNGHYSEITENLGDLGTAVVSRGLATGDYDNDGRLDVLVNNQNGKAQLFHNDDKSANRWVSFKTIGVKSNRDGYGTKLTAMCEGQRYYSEVHGSSSYLSHSDSRVYFGLGQVGKVDSLVIRWPSGLTETLKNVAVDKCYALTEGKGITRALGER